MNLEKIAKLNEVFSPSAPIENKDLFFGRLEQINNIFESVEERGQHAVLYGERGVGKTSLVNIITQINSKAINSKVTCNTNETFKSIWTKALRKVQFYKNTKGIGYKAKKRTVEIQYDLFLPEKDDIDATDLELVFENLNDKVLFVFDEFDRIKDKVTRSRFADVIKSLSDNAPSITILIVGVSEDVVNLIGNHQSLERCLRQVKMPRMSHSELGEIIDKSLDNLNLRISNDVRSKIIEYSSGFPHYTHLLGKYSAKSAINSEKKIIDNIDFNHAVFEAIKNVNQNIKDSFLKATISSKGKTQFENVMYACSLATTDEFDSSTANQIVNKFNLLTKRNVSRESITYNLGLLCKEERGNILQKIGKSKNIKYRFVNPLMKAYLKLKLHNKNNDKSRFKLDN